MTEYALYKGDELLHIGTAEEIAEKQGVKRETVTFYATNSYKERLKKRGILDGNVLIAIKLEDEDD